MGHEGDIKITTKAEAHEERVQLGNKMEYGMQLSMLAQQLC